MGQPNPGVREVMVGSGGASIVEIALFPGETVDGDNAMGKMYVRVRGELVKSYDACGGPPPGKGRLDRGGHTADPTAAGRYRLAAAVPYTTLTWPSSTIPWGAPLRARADGQVEYSADGGKTWRAATGKGGIFSEAWIAFETRGRAADAAATNRENAKKPGYKPIQPEPLTDQHRQSLYDGSLRFFHDANGNVPSTYQLNDFGPWAWNLRRVAAGNLERTGMFVHTTPPNERESAAGHPVVLTPSHGCIHIRPSERDEMMTLGYLQGGVSFVVKPYGVKGP